MGTCMGKRVAEPDVFQCIQEGDIAALDRLFLQDPNILQLNNIWDSKDPVLVWAAGHGPLHVIDRLAARGAPLDITNKYGKTAVMAAAGPEGDLSIVERLVELGAPTSLKDAGGMNALHYTAYSADTAIAALLLRHGLPVDSLNGCGQTPLYIASQCGHEAMIQFFADNGADVRIQDNIGQSALHVAAEYNKVACVRSLIRLGASLDVVRASLSSLLTLLQVDEETRTPLDLARQEGHKDVIAELDGQVSTLASVCLVKRNKF